MMMMMMIVGVIFSNQYPNKKVAKLTVQNYTLNPPKHYPVKY